MSCRLNMSGSFFCVKICGFAIWVLRNLVPTEPNTVLVFGHGITNYHPPTSESNKFETCPYK